MTGNAPSVGRRDPGKAGWLLGLIFVGVAACILAAGSFYYRNYEKHYRLAVERQLSVIADLKVNELAQWRKERLADGYLFFQNASFSVLVRRFLEQPADADAQRQLQTWIGKCQVNNQYDEVLLQDAQGVTRLSSPAGLPAISTLEAKNVSEVLRSGQVTFQDFYRSDNDQEVHLAVLVPIFNELDASRPLGVLILRIDPKAYLYPFIQRWPTPSLTAETLLVRREGNEVVFLNELRFQKNTALTLRRPLDQEALPGARAASGQEGVTKGIDYRGVPVVAALRTIPDSPWFLVARIDTAEVYAPLRERLWLMVVLIGVVLFGAGAGIALLWRQQRVRFYREEEEAENTTRRMATVVRDSNDAITIQDFEGRITAWNHGAELMYGYSEEEALAVNIERLTAPGKVAEQKDFTRRLLAGETVTSFETQRVTKDGRLLDVWLTVTKLVDDAGKVIGIASTERDITERKQAVERIREQAALLDKANDAIYVMALDYTILYWNKGAERTYGWTSAEVLNRKTTELIFPDLSATQALVAALLQKETWYGEQRQNLKSGGMVEVFSRLSLVRNEQGQPRSILAINTDITEKKQLESQFLRAQRLESIGALASGIAHDLNNVLAPIIMGAPLLREGVKDQKARDLLGIMESSAQRGAAIVRQVLTFARGVEGERVPLQPRHLLSAMESLAAETFPKNIKIEIDVAADLWPILGDATQLDQALMNLCVNARDAMPGGGSLTFEAANVVLSKEAAEKMPGAQPGSYVCLRVTDTGTGIPPEVEAKLFEPFFTTKGVGKGTGLGLSTTLGIVRSHGGFLRVASKVGQGTTFELYLPATKAEQVAVKKASTRPWPRARGEAILLVDDEAAVREVARQALMEFGYYVITAGHGTEALRIFKERRQEIQLVVTDMMMPEMDGPTLIAALRVLDPAVKIIGITGASSTKGMSGLKTLALSAMLEKPFTLNKFLAAIKEVMPGTAGHESAVSDAGGSRPTPPG